MPVKSVPDLSWICPSCQLPTCQQRAISFKLILTDLPRINLRERPFRLILSCLLLMQLLSKLPATVAKTSSISFSQLHLSRSVQISATAMDANGSQGCSSSTTSKSLTASSPTQRTPPTISNSIAPLLKPSVTSAVLVVHTSCYMDGASGSSPSEIWNVSMECRRLRGTSSWRIQLMVG